MYWLISFIVCSLVALSTQPAMAKHPQMSAEKIKRIETFVEKRMKEVGAPGLSLALISVGEVVYAKGYGRAEANGTPVTPTTISNVGSITKSYTALAIVQLEADGALSLDDEVTQHIP